MIKYKKTKPFGDETIYELKILFSVFRLYVGTKNKIHWFMIFLPFLKIHYNFRYGWFWKWGKYV